MALEIRPARPQEYERIGALAVAAYAHERDLGESYTRTLRDVGARAESALVLVALEGGAPVGTVTLVAEPGPLHEIAAADEAEFRMLAVLPEAQGTGVAAALVRRCADEAAALGRARLVCSTGAWMAGAQRLYARLGFTRAPARDWSPQPGVDLVVLEAPLSGGAADVPVPR